MLEWTNLCVASSDRPILHSLKGHANKGEMLAILGPTGSGKTTLLDCLAHRLNSELEYSGQVRYSGKRWNKNMKRRVGFIEQDDIVISDLTVRQSLHFLASLRLSDKDFGVAAKKERVENIIAQLRLSKAADTRVGDIGNRGISGGERKRMCIAQEMLVEPDIILADEPTSGLDSTMANITATCLKDLASAGKTVVVTIHQPSSSVFHMFKKVILLDEGKIVYFGPAADAVAYFASLNVICPNNYNPADFLMDCVVLNKLSSVKVQNKLKADFQSNSPDSTNLIKANGYSKENDNQENQITQNIESKQVNITVKTEKQLDFMSKIESNSSLLHTNERYANTWSSQVKILIQRQLMANALTSQFTKPNIFQYCCLSLIAGILWFRVDAHESSIFSRMSIVFWLVGTWTFFPLFNVLFTFPEDEIVVKKELSLSAYRISAYYTSRTALLIPEGYIWACFYLPIVHYMTGINDDFVVFLQLFFAILFYILTLQALGIFISASVPKKNILTCCVVVITFIFAFGGLFVPKNNMGSWYRWLIYLNPMNYGWQLAMKIVFTDALKFHCASPVDTIFPDECNSNVVDRTVGSDAVLAKFDVHYSTWVCVLVLFAFNVVFRILAFRFLRYSWITKHAHLKAL